MENSFVLCKTLFICLDIPCFVQKIVVTNRGQLGTNFDISYIVFIQYSYSIHIVLIQFLYTVYGKCIRTVWEGYGLGPLRAGFGVVLILILLIYSVIFWFCGFFRFCCPGVWIFWGNGVGEGCFARGGGMWDEIFFCFVPVDFQTVRFVLEFFRYDKERGIFWGLSTSQWIAIAMFVIGWIVFNVRFRKDVRTLDFDRL